MEAPAAIKIKSGSVTIRQLGTKLYQAISPSKIIPEIIKSTKLTTTALVGTTNRGKYTFDSRLALLIKLLLHSLNELAKKLPGQHRRKHHNRVR